MTSSEGVSLKTVERLHTLTTWLHVPVYFAREAAEEYAKEGIHGWSGYFGSRTAAMGELPTEAIIATFYNFSPDVVGPATAGLWQTTTAEAMQLARFRLMASIFDDVGRDAMAPDGAALAEATRTLEAVVGGLDWGGKALAAGNHDALAALERSEFADDRLLRLWQLATIVREWRGDAHIAVLTTEPLSPVECTVISWAMTGAAQVKESRGWAEPTWDTAVAGLIERGWMSDTTSMSDDGKRHRAAVETRTNELARAMWAGLDDAAVNHLGDLLKPTVDAIVQSGRLKPIGVRPAT
ncbi:MAG: hypothetical protein AAGA65_01405 [Actinomycetota bacterium]